MTSQIPVTSNPNQTFTVNIPGNSKNLGLKFQITYNGVAKYWMMTLSDPTSGQIYASNIPLLPGYDLLKQFQYKNIGSAYIENIGDQTIESPDDTNLGTTFALNWVLY
jgi:hypothetical protein